MILDSIKEAIKEKAEEAYPNGGSAALMLQRAYASGQEDAIGFMLDFFEILRGDFDEFPAGWECLSEQRCEKWGLQFEIIYGTKQLLVKYLMEDNNL